MAGMRSFIPTLFVFLCLCGSVLADEKPDDRLAGIDGASSADCEAEKGKAGYAKSMSRAAGWPSYIADQWNAKFEKCMAEKHKREIAELTPEQRENFRRRISVQLCFWKAAGATGRRMVTSERKRADSQGFHFRDQVRGGVGLDEDSKTAIEELKAQLREINGKPSSCSDRSIRTAVRCMDTDEDCHGDKCVHPRMPVCDEPKIAELLE